MQIFGLILLTLHSLCVLHVEKWLKCLAFESQFVLFIKNQTRSAQQKIKSWDELTKLKIHI